MSLKFGQIRLLVSMATDRGIVEKNVLPLFLPIFYPILFIIAGDMHESSEELNFCQIRLLTAELAALERLKSLIDL